PPAGKEIAALILKDDPETRAKRFVYTFPRSGPSDVCDRPRFVPLWTMYESLQYPLLFFHGEPGWNLGARPSKTYLRNRLPHFIYGRPGVGLRCVFAARGQRPAVDFIASNRCQRRITSFNAIHKAVRNAPTGKRVPTSFHASPANRKKNQLDAMSVVTRKGKPHLMITMTCNSNWPEIQ
ncbi:unnamed protein product, partial [Laminaria digitata]